MRTISSRKTNDHRSALEARWAIFFRELNLKWKYEPHLLRADRLKYLPDFHIEGFGYIEIKPSLELFIKETSRKVAAIAEWNPTIKIYGFFSDHVEIRQTVLYQGDKMFAPEPRHVYGLLSYARIGGDRLTVEQQNIDIKRAMQIANTTKFDPWRDMKSIVLDVINGLQKMYEKPA